MTACILHQQPLIAAVLVGSGCFLQCCCLSLQRSWRPRTAAMRNDCEGSVHRPPACAWLQRRRQHHPLAFGPASPTPTHLTSLGPLSGLKNLRSPGLQSGHESHARRRTSRARDVIACSCCADTPAAETSGHGRASAAVKHTKQGKQAGNQDRKQAGRTRT